MKPHPLYRSLTFWSGILMMAFICWAWWDSTQCLSTFTWPGGRVVHRFSGASITWSSACATDEIEASREEPEGMSKTWKAEPFPPPLLLTRSRTFDPFDDRYFELMGTAGVWPKNPMGMHLDGLKFGSTGDRFIFIPHWILLLGVALPWSGMLVWRARRMRRRGR